MMRSSARLLSTAACVAVALGGCASDGELLDRESVAASIADNINGAIAVEDAIERVARVCMEQLGFTVHPSYEFVSDSPDGAIEDLLGETVYTDPDPALPYDQVYGIGFDSGISVTRERVTDSGDTVPIGEVDDFSAQSVDQQSEYFAGYSGSPDLEVEQLNLPDVGPSERAAGGCKREAEDAVTDSGYPDYLNHAGIAGAKGDTGWENDDKVVDARIEWSICMVESGLDEYLSPLDLKLGLASEMLTDYYTSDLVPGTEAYSAAESRFAEHLEEIAEIDHACHEDTGLQQIQEDVYWDYMTTHVSAFEDEFYSFHQRTEEFLTEAQEIIKAGHL